MTKALIVFLLILSSLLIGGPSCYAFYRLDHQKFVHMTETEKKLVVKEIMKLVVELESQYRYDTKKSPLKNEKLKKFTQLIEKLENALINQAYADGSEWNRGLVKFSAFLKEPNRCLYAGWISQLNSQGKCTHPMNLPKASQERQAYKSGCKEPSQISCNPIIFGYKKISDASAFCVNAGPQNNNAHNASLLCMTKALKEPNEGDSKDQRLAYLAAELAKNKALAKELFDFISKACLCDPGPENLNKQYHLYMQPHRTCYGLMKMVSEVSNVCPQPIVEESNISIFKTLQSKILEDQSGVPSSFDTFYSGFLVEVSDNAEFKKVCEGLPTVAESQDQNDTSNENGGGSQTPTAGQPTVPVVPNVIDSLNQMNQSQTDNIPSQVDNTVNPINPVKPNVDSTPTPEQGTVPSQTTTTNQQKTETNPTKNEAADVEKTKVNETKKSDFSLSLTLTGKATDKNVTVTATVSPELKEGYSVFWYDKKTDAAPAKSSIGNLGEAVVPGTEEGKTAEEKAKAEREKEKKLTIKDLLAVEGVREITTTANEKMKVIRPRESTTYKICARVTKGDDTETEEVCKDVDPIKEAPKPSTGIPGNFMPPGGMMMQPSRTGGDLILRGVR